MENETLITVARMRSDFPTKFGIPKQSGLVTDLRSTIVFEPDFRNPDALRGIEGFSHLWLIWGFSASKRNLSPTVRPPRLGGNVRIGVFATRSPFRPNPVGLSCVRLLGIEQTVELGHVLHVAGADLMDGSPIYDIKPYVPYADCHPDALSGFAGTNDKALLTVEISEALLARVPQEKQGALLSVLQQDPRPPYQDDADRVYGMEFAGLEINFQVADGRLAVLDIQKA